MIENLPRIPKSRNQWRFAYAIFEEACSNHSPFHVSLTLIHHQARLHFSKRQRCGKTQISGTQH